MAKNDPVTGPFPDGDSRNITLTPSTHPMEPERSGPAEPGYRREGAPDSVMGDLAPGEYKPGYRQEARDDGDPDRQDAADDAPAAEMGFGSVGGAIDPVALGNSEDDPATRVRTDAARPLGGK
ncbi:hypothetical protein Ga0102493_11661 [Erythrobacter litoralis]|jgi:hypothetical protein|uniref:Uncharacterized protein n=1 Tax=Erythrobacter litoralis TaxID=39960 RepID=A0A074MY48_9SPHN|nr:hypothetical protein [Erythrobacter litoralis]AOL24791.1 hypothetical protein Ga0102493_11661 [Erythrobacter litoralis]KEO96768.1 hypothetical protein EH32_08785 [Erythrobacter litoralis]MEE4338942.1 hypothetical protein [Erythrobacter sp.]